VGRANLRLVVSERQEAAPQASPARSLDDAELLTALIHGDDSAATELHDRLHPRILATVRRLLGPADRDVDDCVQNAFVELVASIDRYRGECPLEHWAARIAAFVVYKHIRQRRRERKTMEPLQELGAEPADRASPVRRLVMRDLFARVRAKLSGLDEDKTYAFLLHDVLGFDVAEVAEITGVSVAAAQKRLFRGRREVHAQLMADRELASRLQDSEDGT
jgi:RNA polymerase sigma-70 factor (ECF subfamily)